MKKLLLLLLLPVVGYGQTFDTTYQKPLNKMETVTDLKHAMHNAGWRMERFASLYSVGIGLQVGGIATIGVGIASKTDPVTVAGGVIGLTGFIITLSAPHFLRDAGIMLENGSLEFALDKRK